MTTDYDLVVIGATLEAITAAKSALELGARVALIVPSDSFPNAYAEEIYYQAWNYVNSSRQNNFNIQTTFSEMLSILTEQNYYQLAVMGVDIIFGKPNFFSTSKPYIVVNKRKLTAISYLIATSCHSFIPNIQGIEKVNYLIPEDIYQKENLEILPENIVIIGNSITAIKLAQQLNQIGKKITLLLPKKQILPYEDKEVSFLIQAVLEAEGIKIFTNSIVTQVRQIENSKWLQAGKQAIETDEIIITISSKKPNISGFNLESVGVKITKQGIKINQKLQTTNPRIYACGDVIGGYNLSHVAEYEAKIAVKNALFGNLCPINYNNLPYTIFTNPPIARVGFTEKQAQKYYGDKFQVIKSNYSQLPLAKITDNNTGFCKLILLPNGQILGGHLVGKNASELIGIIALAREKKIKLQKISEFINCSLTYSEIIKQTIHKWNENQLLKNKNLMSLLETFFIWRRSWFS